MTTRAHCWPSLGSTDYTVGCPDWNGRSYRDLEKCQQKTSFFGVAASNCSRDMLGDVDMDERPVPMEEVPPLPPPPALDPSVQKDALMVAAVHPYGHEEPEE